MRQPSIRPEAIRSLLSSAYVLASSYSALVALDGGGIPIAKLRKPTTSRALLHAFLALGTAIALSFLLSLVRLARPLVAVAQAPAAQAEEPVSLSSVEQPLCPPLAAVREFMELEEI